MVHRGVSGCHEAAHTMTKYGIFGMREADYLKPYFRVRVTWALLVIAAPLRVAKTNEHGLSGLQTNTV